MVDLIPPGPAAPVRQPLTAYLLSWLVILAPTITLAVLALIAGTFFTGQVH
jgi:hypothetical protein